MIKKIKVEGMSCGHCVKRVEKALNAIDGVTGVVVDLTLGQVDLDMNRDIDFRVLHDAVDEAGYDATGEL